MPRGVAARRLLDDSKQKTMIVLAVWVVLLVFAVVLATVLFVLLVRRLKARRRQRETDVAASAPTKKRDVEADAKTIVHAHSAPRSTKSAAIGASFGAASDANSVSDTSVAGAHRTPHAPNP